MDWGGGYFVDDRLLSTFFSYSFRLLGLYSFLYGDLDVIGLFIGRWMEVILLYSVTDWFTHIQLGFLHLLLFFALFYAAFFFPFFSSLLLVPLRLWRILSLYIPRVSETGLGSQADRRWVDILLVYLYFI